MPEYRAPMWPMTVVACKCPRGIIRAITSFGRPAEMVDAIVRQVGKMNLADTEWTGYVYGLPAYATTDRVYPTSGVFLWPWKKPPTDELQWKGDRRVLGYTEQHPILLDRPPGWSCGGHDIFQPLWEAALLQANGQETDMNDDRCERCGRPVPDDWDLTAVPVDPESVRLSLRELEPGETVTDYMLLCERCQDNEGAV